MVSIKTKEKVSTWSSIVSSFISFLGGYQVCHSVCLAIVSVLSLIGITIVGMPLLFLQKVAIPFWIAAVVLLGITLFFYFRKKCISRNLILFNFGILIIGIPFQFLQNYNLIFWIIGGLIVLISIILFIMEKVKK